jgi:cell division protease FtsH
MENYGKDPAGTGRQSGKGGPNLTGFLITGIVIIFLLNIIISNLTTSQKVQIEYGQFINLIKGGMVKQVQIETDQIALTLKPDADRNEVQKILRTSPDVLAINDPSAVRPKPFASQTERGLIYYTGRLDDPGLTERLIANNVAFYKPIIRSNPIMDFISSWILPFLIFYGIYWFIMWKFSAQMGGGLGGMMNVGKSKAKIYDMEKNTGVSFADVAGQDEAKESLLRW